MNPLAWRKRGIDSGTAAAQPEHEREQNKHVPSEEGPSALQLLAGFLAKLALLGTTVLIRMHFRLPRMLEEACQSEIISALHLS